MQLEREKIVAYLEDEFDSDTRRYIDRRSTSSYVGPIYSLKKEGCDDSSHFACGGARLVTSHDWNAEDEAMWIRTGMTFNIPTTQEDLIRYGVQPLVVFEQ